MKFEPYGFKNSIFFKKTLYLFTEWIFRSYNAVYLRGRDEGSFTELFTVCGYNSSFSFLLEILTKKKNRNRAGRKRKESVVSCSKTVRVQSINPQTTWSI